MKHCLLILFIALFTASKATSQKLFFLFGHTEYAAPTGELKQKHNFGLGMEAGIGIGTNKTFFTGTIGSTWMIAKDDNPGSEGGLRSTPIKLGLRRYILLKNLFVKADAGVAGVKFTDTDKKTTQFTTSLGAGVKFTRFEAVADFNTITAVGSWVGIKFGMIFGL